MGLKHDIESRILYEDNHLLVINKWSGLLSQGDRTGDLSLIDLAKEYIKHKYKKPGDVFLGLPHRLDRPTSGAIICCRTSKALNRVNEIIRKGKLDKVYHVLCVAEPQEHAGSIVSYLRKNSKTNKVQHSFRKFEGAKEAILSYKYLCSTAQGHHLMEVALETGRPHQIRVQMKAIGCPVLGDLRYSNQMALPDKSIGLHAYQLKFVHPVQKIPIIITAPYPDKAWWKIN